ncbi:MAG: acylphosphatase [Bacteroidales bacterium]|jgi:acylphosphatase|nr:acylphosphatase [Bacteroidales bacterium]
MIKAVTIKVNGRLQNVGYRHYARLAAQDYGIAGKFLNLDDGSVYIEAQGEEQGLQDFIDYCKKGPAWARIDGIDIQPAEVNEELTRFDA